MGMFYNKDAVLKGKQDVSSMTIEVTIGTGAMRKCKRMSL